MQMPKQKKRRYSGAPGITEKNLADWFINNPTCRIYCGIFAALKRSTTFVAEKRFRRESRRLKTCFATLMLTTVLIGY